ncbi:hypothetical protein ABEB36_009548 [Hypothenemus hampei]|uniref:Uncharacterized protein n=1 Tax=Hypothenemus hampei TaxID=57062 RepID=A0ABD1EGP2_HYPHA
MSTTVEAYILFLFFMIIMFLLYGFFQKRLHVEADILNNPSYSSLGSLVQDRVSRRYYFEFASPGPNDIINSISGRRIQDPIQHYPNSHLPNEHITFTNEQNKFSKSDDGLPSYEEAIKLSMAHSNSLQTYQTELAQTHQQPQSTTATRNNIRMVPGTVLSQTTE